MDKEKAIQAMELLLNEAVKKGLFGDAASVVRCSQAIEFVKTMEPVELRIVET